MIDESSFSFIEFSRNQLNQYCVSLASKEKELTLYQGQRLIEKQQKKSERKKTMEKFMEGQYNRLMDSAGVRVTIWAVCFSVWAVAAFGMFKLVI